MSNYLRKAIINTTIIFAFSLFSMAAAYAFRLALARNLAPDQFGLFYAVLSFTILVHTFHDPGLKAAIIKLIPEFLVKGAHEKISSAICHTLAIWTTLSGMYTILTAVFAQFLAANFFKVPDQSLLIIILSAAFLMQSIDYLIGYIFQGFQKMGLFASIDFARMTLYLLITLAGFHFYPASVIVPAIAYLASPIIIALAYFPIFKKAVFPRFSFTKSPDFPLLKKMMAFGIPVTLVSLSYSIFQQSSTLILTYFKPLTEVALLNIALPTSTLLINLSTSVTYVIFPLTAELWAHGYHKHLQEGITLLYRYSVMAIIPASFAIAAFPELIITLLFGPEYTGASRALQILSISALFWIIANINFTFLAGIDKSKDPLKIMTAITILSIILNFALIPSLGINGAAWSIATSYFFAMAISIADLKRHIAIRVPITHWIKNAIAGTIFLGSIHAIKKLLVMQNQYIEAILTLTAAGTIYLALIILLKIATIEEMKAYMTRAMRKDHF